jgi:hypothetical protein
VVIFKQRLVRQIGILLALLVALDLVVMAGVEPLALADSEGRAATALGRVALYHHLAGPLDVVLMGSSRVQCDLDSTLLMNRAQAALGRTPGVLNLGLAGATPQANYWLLKNVIRPDKQPSLLIYGTSEYEFNPNGGRIPSWNYADELATVADYGQAFPDATRSLDAQMAFLLGRVWHLFRYRERLHDILLDVSAADAPEGAERSAQELYGFLPLNHEMRPVDVRKIREVYTGRPGHLQDYTVAGYQAARFEQLLALAQARGIRVIVINMPITTIQEGFLSPADYAAYRAYLRDVTSRFQIPFYDYNDHALWQEPTDFADPNHMNRIGAKKLSQRVSQEVVLPALEALWK